MAVFLDRKEQVYDLKLTSYGRHLLSVGTFKPVYYAFYDDNILYDARYAHTASSVYDPLNKIENQNDVNRRIKEETVYLESQILFRDTEDSLSSLDYLDYLGDDETKYHAADKTAMQIKPDADVFKFESMIGDAMLDAENSRAVPAWKVLMMQGEISSSIYRQGESLSPPHVGLPRDGIILNSSIPQINITASYALSVTDDEVEIDPSSVRSILDTSNVFADGKIIQLESKDPILYFEETNTKLLVENYDIEVFEVESGSRGGIYSPILHRRYFEKQTPQIENGFMLMETPLDNPEQSLTTASVEYHFDILRDSSVDQAVACQGMEEFDKGSYYISFDFDCEESDTTATFYDIYGSVTEPEICRS